MDHDDEFPFAFSGGRCAPSRPDTCLPSCRNVFRVNETGKRSNGPVGLRGFLVRSRVCYLRARTSRVRAMHSLGARTKRGRRPPWFLADADRPCIALAFRPLETSSVGSLALEIVHCSKESKRGNRGFNSDDF